MSYVDFLNTVATRGAFGEDGKTPTGKRLMPFSLTIAGQTYNFTGQESMSSQLITLTANNFAGVAQVAISFTTGAPEAAITAIKAAGDKITVAVAFYDANSETAQTAPAAVSDTDVQITDAPLNVQFGANAVSAQGNQVTVNLSVDVSKGAGIAAKVNGDSKPFQAIHG
jgi:hypothetical protein